MENLKFKDKLRRLNKKRIALCTIGAIVIGTPLVSTVVKKFKKSDNNKSILYLMDIKNENKLKLYSKDGKIVDSKIDITKDMYAITDIKDHDKNSLYNVYIVKHVEIPLSIVECGFLSNPEEEQLLLTDEYQNKLAWGIYTGIMDYFYN